MATQIAKRDNEGKLKIENPQSLSDVIGLVSRYKPQIMAAIPGGVDGDVVIRRAIMCLRNNPDLLKCTPASLFHAISEAVANGLEIGGIRPHCYIVPYDNWKPNEKKKVTEARLQIGYKGYLELLDRTGRLKSSTFALVHEGDTFEYELGDEEFFRHKPSNDKDRKSRPVTHVYCIFRMKDGGIVRNIWTAADIQAHKEQYSQAWRSAERYIEQQDKAKKPIDERRLSPWHTNWREQAIKTVVRDTFQRGRLPMQDSIQLIVERQSQMEAGKSVDSDQTLESLESAFGQPQQQQSIAPPQKREEESADVYPETEEDWLADLGARLIDAKTLGAVTVLREEFEDKSDVESYRADVNLMCDSRENQIREARSGKK